MGALLLPSRLVFPAHLTNRVAPAHPLAQYLNNVYIPGVGGYGTAWDRKGLRHLASVDGTPTRADRREGRFYASGGASTDIYGTVDAITGYPISMIVCGYFNSGASNWGLCGMWPSTGLGGYSCYIAYAGTSTAFDYVFRINFGTTATVSATSLTGVTTGALFVAVSQSLSATDHRFYVGGNLFSSSTNAGAWSANFNRLVIGSIATSSTDAPLTNGLNGGVLFAACGGKAIPDSLALEVSRNPQYFLSMFQRPAFLRSIAGVAAATAVTLSGPSSGTVATASTNFTVGVSGGSITGTLVVTPATDVGSGGTFSPTSVSLTDASPIGTFTFTPAVSGVTHAISVTNDGGLSNPSAVDYAVDPAVSVTLVASPTDATPAANLSSLKWAWFDDATPNTLVAPTDQGASETTNGSGLIFIPLPNSSLGTGDVGWLLVSNSDGTTTQSPPAKMFSGPVAVL